MKIAFYQMRPFDEQAYIEQFSREFGIDYVTIPGAPCPENLDKAAGCDAVSQNPCEILPEYVEAWARMGVKYLLCRSIGYDHIPLETAKKLGMRVAHSHYPPEGVANYAIMLMLMCTRKMNQTMLRAAAQDYTLPGKMGKDLSNCTVGVIGTGKIGRTVIAHLQGFGCKILAYDLYQSDEVAQMAEYVPLDELYARSDVITLHTNATAENHHLINAESLAKMKDGVLIVNTARGALVDEEAVADALQAAGLPMFAAMPFFSGYTTGNLLNVLYICVFVTAGGYACYFMGMEATSAMQGSLVFFFKPVLAPILAMLILGEEIPWNMWAGIGLMLVASVVSMIPTWETLLAVRPFLIERILHRQH